MRSYKRKQLQDLITLTHTIDLNNEANTLKVKCYFNDEIALEDAKPQLDELTAIILNELSSY